MTFTMGTIAAVCLGLAIAFMVKKLAKRTVVYLMLIVGVTGLGGAAGAIVTKIVQSGVNGAANATDRLLGVGVGAFICAAVLTIFIWPHVKPKSPQPPTRATPWLALAWGTVAAAAGGVFAQAAGFSGNIVAQGITYLNSGLTAFFQGF